MDVQKNAWEQSYQNRDNFVFLPHEEVVRFVSRHIRRRTGPDSFEDVHSLGRTPRVLDLGCGIGRHVLYAHEMGLEAWGVDLSDVAVGVARTLVAGRLPEPDRRIVQGDVRALPWPDGFFDHAVSHGVLDSMHFAVARAAVRELSRAMAPGGLFYCDLVSGDDRRHGREYAGEEVVATRHEHGTIQCYFNHARVQELFAGLFDPVESILIRRENVITGAANSRYHLTLRNLGTGGHAHPG